MCDRWFGYFMESLRVLGLLDNTMVIFTTDHGHSIGDRNYMGKRGYPSAPEVFDVPLMVRFPGAEHAGGQAICSCSTTTSQTSFWNGRGRASRAHRWHIVRRGRPGRETGIADHVTVGWGSAATVVTDRLVVQLQGGWHRRAPPRPASWRSVCQECCR